MDKKIDTLALRSWSDVAPVFDAHGDSFYLLDDTRFETNFLALRNAFQAHYPNSWIGYSYKTNYTPYLCKRVDQLGGYAEVVSEMEYTLAERIGARADRIIFNGPYKSKPAFEKALRAGSVVNLDSGRDLKMLFEVAAQYPEQTFGVVLRCNFELTEEGLSRFGFDINGPLFHEAVAAIAACENTYLSGLHCHFPDRNLESYRIRVRQMIDLCKVIFPYAPPEYLNLGGGFFGQMPDSLKQAFNITHVSFEEYGEALAKPIADAFGTGDQAPKLMIEPGTAVVADTFRFFARVLDVKQVRGRNLATLTGSIFNISPVARNLNLPVRVLSQTPTDAASDSYDIVGYTCIEGDFMTKGYQGKIEIGDFVEYSNVGSYSVVMKPPFILPSAPILRLDRDTGQPVIVKNRETTDYIFQNFVDD